MIRKMFLKDNLSSVNNQAFFNIVSQVILNGTNFILIMLYANYLSTDNYGIVTIYQAYVSFFSAFVGLNSQGSIAAAFIHLDNKEHSNYLSSIMLMSLSSFMFFLLICSVFISNLVKYTQLNNILIYLILGHSFGIFCYNFLNIKFTYLKKAHFSALLAFFIAFLTILTTYVGLRFYNEAEYLIRILGLAIPYIICAICISITILLKGNPLIKIRDYWLYCLPICIPLIFHGISQVILSQTDKIMLQKMTTDLGQVGIYGFIMSFSHILGAIYTALNNTWVPIYYEYTKQSNTKTILLRGKKYNAFFTYLVMGFILVSPEFIHWFANSDYWPGIKIIPLAALAQYMIFLYSFAVNFEFYHKKTQWIALGTTAAAFFNIIFNFLLIPRYGIVGAVIATCVSYALLFVFHQICAKNIIKGSYPFKNIFFVKGLILTLSACFVYYIFCEQWYVRWIFAFIIGMKVLYILYKDKKIF